MGISDFLIACSSLKPVGSPGPAIRISQVHVFPQDTRRPRTTPDGPVCLLGFLSYSAAWQTGNGFTIHERLATIDFITRLNKVHLRYGSHLRLFQTQCNSLPPYILKLLETARTAASAGLSPAGFYTRLLAYRVAVKVASQRTLLSCRLWFSTPHVLGLSPAGFSARK